MVNDDTEPDDDNIDWDLIRKQQIEDEIAWGDDI
jgi:hypothetical protein